MKKVIIISSVLIFVGLCIYFYLINSKNESYNGGYAPSGEYCDYGYKNATKSCCDEDDYSCMFCDAWGIYCNTTDIVQDFYDIASFEDRTSRGDYDCSDLGSWETSQKVFIRDGGPKKDPYNLDEDKDGVACEVLRP